MEITAKEVMQLRKKTGVGMMACKKALKEAGGDIEKAVEFLRKSGEAKAASKASRETAEGRIAIVGKAMVKVLCETDFVGKNEIFQELLKELANKANNEGVEEAKKYFEEIKGDKVQEIGENLVLDAIEKVEGDVVGTYLHTNEKVGTIVVLEGGTEEMAKDVAMHATAMDPLVANPEDMPAEEIEKEKEIYKEQLVNEGKPENIIDKIIEGKVKKFCAERALTSQPFVKDPSQTVAEYLGDAKLIKFIRHEI